MVKKKNKSNQSNRMWWNTAASHQFGKGGLTQRIAFQLIRLHREIRATASTTTGAAPIPGGHRVADCGPAKHRCTLVYNWTNVNYRSLQHKA